MGYSYAKPTFATTTTIWKPSASAIKCAFNVIFSRYEDALQSLRSLFFRLFRFGTRLGFTARIERQLQKIRN